MSNNYLPNSTFISLHLAPRFYQNKCRHSGNAQSDERLARFAVHPETNAEQRPVHEETTGNHAGDFERELAGHYLLLAKFAVRNGRLDDGLPACRPI